MSYDYQKRLNKLADCADNQLPDLSKFTHRLIYQVLDEYDHHCDLDMDSFNEWRSCLVGEIKEVLDIIDQKRWLDIQYLTRLKLIIDAENVKDGCKGLVNSIKLNLN